jgi:hypothetical protein
VRLKENRRLARYVSIVICDFSSGPGGLFLIGSGGKKTTSQRGEDRSEIHHQHAWGVWKYCSYRELVMEDAAKKRLATMPAKERSKEIRAAIADGL